MGCGEICCASRAAARQVGVIELLERLRTLGLLLLVRRSVEAWEKALAAIMTRKVGYCDRARA